MEEESGMELLKLLGFGAEIKHRRGSAGKPCLEDSGNVKEM